MTYYFFPLTKEEASDPKKTGYTYALKNKDRWLSSTAMLEVNTYDKGTTHIVCNDIAYTIYKDYLDIINELRVYIGKPSLIGADN